MSIHAATIHHRLHGDYGREGHSSEIFFTSNSLGLREIVRIRHGFAVRQTEIIHIPREDPDIIMAIFEVSGWRGLQEILLNITNWTFKLMSRVTGQQHDD